MTKENKTIKKLAIDKGKITQFCQKNHIRQLSFFGSILRSDFNDKSDIDVLVEFHNQANVGLFELYDMEQELSNLFDD
ncbi:MAG: nucleotidyltransferase domain-containing protein [Bdellovibrionales bacterium]|nr:nucleotidyltransferase domain-containing protein [Bdellovibrionales bacterium]